ncbi:hypothetical protein SAMN05216529_11640 [Faecalicatena contorta]|uniref:Uncharacterized protein n=1 Tax=Faecalicatena contorta TaxID=39482 RepID=A0A315ZQB6_9FIRM|nr:hypothetical protein A8805_11640 [Faecalicatena contorta]SUQ15779.1 hypothetical protein SAMN05216529_11640 [Faecalicatena contorta]
MLPFGRTAMLLFKLCFLSDAVVAGIPFSIIECSYPWTSVWLSCNKKLMKFIFS